MFYSGQKIKKKWWFTVYSSKVQQSHLRVTNLYATPVSHIYFFVCVGCVWLTAPKLSKKRFKKKCSTKLNEYYCWFISGQVFCELLGQSCVSFAVCTPRRKAFIPEGKNNSKMNIIKKRLLAVVVWGGKWAFHIVELWTPGGDAWWIRRECVPGMDAETEMWFPT